MVMEMSEMTVTESSSFSSISNMSDEELRKELTRQGYVVRVENFKANFYQRYRNFVWTNSSYNAQSIREEAYEHSRRAAKWKCDQWDNERAWQWQ